MNPELWQNTTYQQTALLVLGFLFFVGALMWPFRNKHSNFVVAWASLKSWLFIAPMIFLILALGGYWPLVALTLVALLCAKEFFQITGMYHKSSFVWITYLGIIALAFCIQYKMDAVYDLMPMIIFGTIMLVPIMLNSYKNMVQYMALSMFNYFFMGWGFMHIGRILTIEEGTFYMIYIMILTEVCDNIALASSRLFGKVKLVDNITPRRTLEGLLISFAATLILAYGLRHLLPIRDWPYWLASGLVAYFVGSMGDLALAVIRRDLGVKDVGAFIIGRGSLLDMMDRIIFVAPIYFYTLKVLHKVVP